MTTDSKSNRREHVDMSADIREQISKVILEEFTKLPQLLEEIEPEQRINLIIKMMPFVMSKVEQAKFWQIYPR